jgi:hypothetical protein
MKENFMMNDKQLAVLYTIMLVLWVGTFVLLDQLSKVPIETEDYADRLCQELYGPQTGAHWDGNTLLCQTVRGEILQLREPK